MSDDTTSPHNLVAVILHWALAVAIVAALATGLYASSLPFSPARLRWLNWHKWLGVAILVASVFRLCWRLARPVPDLPETIVKQMPRWQQHAHHGTHIAMYGLFLSIPLAGWVYSSMAGFPVVWFGVLRLPDLVSVDKQWAPALREAHKLLAYGLALLVSLHVAAVIKHQWYDRDGLLHRMWPASWRLRRTHRSSNQNSM